MQAMVVCFQNLDSSRAGLVVGRTFAQARRARRGSLIDGGLQMGRGSRSGAMHQLGLVHSPVILRSLQSSTSVHFSMLHNSSWEGATQPQTALPIQEGAGLCWWCCQRPSSRLVISMCQRLNILPSAIFTPKLDKPQKRPTGWHTSNPLLLLQCLNYLGRQPDF